MEGSDGQLEMGFNKEPLHSALHEIQFIAATDDNWDACLLRVPSIMCGEQGAAKNQSIQRNAVIT